MSTVIRTWNNAAGDVIGTIEEGVQSKVATNDKCAEWLFSNGAGGTMDWSDPYRVTIYRDRDVVPHPDENQHPNVMGRFCSDLAEAERYVQSHIPLRNIAAQITLTMKVTTSEVWQMRGAVKQATRRRLIALARRHGADVRVCPRITFIESYYYFLTDADLNPGYTMELVRAAYDWRGMGPTRIKLYLEDLNDPEKQAERAADPTGWRAKHLAEDRAKVMQYVEDYKLLLSEGAAPIFAEQARGWCNGWGSREGIPDPLTIDFGVENSCIDSY